MISLRGCFIYLRTEHQTRNCTPYFCHRWLNFYACELWKKNWAMIESIINLLRSKVSYCNKWNNSSWGTRWKFQILISHGTVIKGGDCNMIGSFCGLIEYFVYHYELWLKPLRSWAMDFMWIIITKWSEGQQETTPSFKWDLWGVDDNKYFPTAVQRNNIKSLMSRDWNLSNFKDFLRSW